MGIIKLIIGLPLLLILLVFAFVNNDMASFSLWPLGIEVTVSLSVAIVFLVLIGYILGWFFTWISYGSVRSSLRAHKKENKKLSKEQEKLVKEMEGLHNNIENMKAATVIEQKPTWKDSIKKAFGIKNNTPTK